MKEPLLSLDPSPDPEDNPEPALPAPVRSRVMGGEERPASRHRPAQESLIDPRMLSAPASPTRPPSRKVQSSLLILSLGGTGILLAGVLIGMRISDYHHFRYFEGRFAKLSQGQTPPPRETAPLPAAALPPPPVPAAPIVSAPPADTSPLPPASPSVSESGFNSELAALRQERQLVSQRFEQLNSGNPALPASPNPGAPPSPSSFDAFPPSAPAKQELTQEQIRIQSAPAIARIREYDSDWHFVVLDGGKERNIATGTQLAVRRGHEILGLIRVDEVLDGESVAELVGDWRIDSQAPKPRRGDDVLTYPLF